MNAPSVVLFPPPIQKKVVHGLDFLERVAGSSIFVAARRRFLAGASACSG